MHSIYKNGEGASIVVGKRDLYGGQSSYLGQPGWIRFLTIKARSVSPNTGKQGAHESYNRVLSLNGRLIFDGGSIIA
jgi:hypothetical protein